MTGDVDVPGPYWFDLGDVSVVPLVEILRLPIEPAEFFPQIGADRYDWCFDEPWFDRRTGTLGYTIQSFLVVTTRRVLLVDACVGDFKRRGRPQFHEQDSGWASRLAVTGLTPADVDTVVFTHLHVDHVGQATRAADGEWVPAFPAARHLVTEAEYRYWTSPAGSTAMQRTGDYLADSIAPLMADGLVEFCAPDTTLCPEVRLLPAAGHTPGNVCVEVSGSDARLLIVGDIVHHPLQLLHPDWSTRYCVDAGQATATRLEFLADAAATGTPVLPAHFAAPSAGRVVPAEQGWGFVPVEAQDILRVGQFVRRRSG